MIEGDSIRVVVGPEDLLEFRRLDHFLAHKIEHLSRTFLVQLFKKDLIGVDEDEPLPPKKLELKSMPPAGTVLRIFIPPPPPADTRAEDLPLDILYQDEDLLFVHKAAGMVTHPAPGHPGGTLANAVLYHCPGLEGKRPGIVHRLDKGTSGVMVVAKTRRCHEALSLLFSRHELERVYRALVTGVKMPPRGSLAGNIGRDPRRRTRMAVRTDGKGRRAVTHYKVLEYFKRVSHLELTLETGRTHQIRVHLSALLKAPVLCDPVYGGPSPGGSLGKILKEYPHPLLHAQRLALVHPFSKKKLAFEVPPPAIFQRALEELRR